MTVWQKKSSIPDRSMHILTYKLGTLEYRSVRFETETTGQTEFPGKCSCELHRSQRLHGHESLSINGLSSEKMRNGQELPKTVISREYSSEWKPGDEPYYPVNDEKNGKLYARI